MHERDVERELTEQKHLLLLLWEKFAALEKRIEELENK